MGNNNPRFIKYLFNYISLVEPPIILAGKCFLRSRAIKLACLSIGSLFAITLQAELIEGTGGHDVLVGTSENDVFVLGKGSDTLSGLAGDDVFQFTADANSFFGGSKNFDGGEGQDSILGTSDNDNILVRSLNNIENIDGASGYNKIELRYSSTNTLDFSNTTLTNIDELNGNGGHSNITGSVGDDFIVGGGGDDTLKGGSGNDVFGVTGTAHGSDHFDGGDGVDTILGSASDDVIGIRGITDIETIDGGDGYDTIIMRYSPTDILDLSSVTLIGVEEISGHGDHITIIGTTDADRIFGGGGDDTLRGNAGDDTFLVTGTAHGSDHFDGGDGVDTILGSASDDVIGIRGITDIETIDGGDGYDVLAMRHASIEILDVSNVTLIGIEELNGSGDHVTIIGTGGDDYIVGGTGNDNLNGGAGDDTFSVVGTTHGSDHYDGGDGQDTIKGSTGDEIIAVRSLVNIETVDGGDGYDVLAMRYASIEILDVSNVTLIGIEELNGSGDHVTIIGTGGDDYIVGGTGNDNLNGGAGDDTFSVVGTTHGSDHYDGGDGQDTIKGSTGDDIIAVRSLVNIETVDGGDGYDVLAMRYASIEILDVSNVTLIGIEELNGSGDHVTIIGSTNADRIFGGTGNDILRGNGGDDTFLVSGTSHGLDRFDGGEGYDSIVGSSEDDAIGILSIMGIERIDGGDGYDVLKPKGTVDFSQTEMVSIEAINVHNSKHDIVTGSSAADLFLLGKGNDTLYGIGGDDTFQLTSHVGNYIPRYSGGNGFDTLLGTDGDDNIRMREFTGEFTVERIDGSEGYDTIVHIQSGVLDFRNVELVNLELIVGHSGSDTIYGSNANDIIAGNTGSDILSGGNGNDLYRFLKGDDNDVITDLGNPANIDTLEFTGGLSPDDLWFIRDDNDLVIYVLNVAGDKLELPNWYVNPNNQIEVFTTDIAHSSFSSNGIGSRLVSTQLQPLVDAMTNIGAPNSVNVLSLTPEQQATVTALISTAWAPNGSMPEPLDDDGDGVPNENDFYPDDAERYLAGQISNLTVVLSGSVAQLTWQEPEHGYPPFSYNIYRTENGMANYTLLNSTPVPSTLYQDTTVANDTSYQYKVTAIGDDGTEVEAAINRVVYVAFNDITVQEVHVARDLLTGHISWRLDSTESSLIPDSLTLYRAEALGEFEPLTVLNLDEHEYRDDQAVWSRAYRYQFKTVKQFINSLTGESLSLESISPEFVLDALSPVSTTLDNAQFIDGRWQMTVPPGTVIINGAYENAITSARAVFTVGDNELSSLETSGAFSFALFDVTESITAQIEIREQTQADRAINIYVDIVVADDSQAPELTITSIDALTSSDSSYVLPASQPTVTIYGEVTDNLSGIKSTYATNQRYPGQEFGIIVESNGTFIAELPIKHGVNALTLYALDNSGNLTSKPILVRRNLSLQPVLEITSPADGSVLEQPLVTITGEILSGLPSNEIQVFLNGTQILFPEEGSDPGQYIFTFENQSLMEGDNTFVIRAVSTAGDATESVVVVYKAPGEGSSEVADESPLIEITSPDSELTTSSDSISITGRVSGKNYVASITANGEPVDFALNPDGAGGFEYTYVIPAEECGFTLQVTDVLGNATEYVVACTQDKVLPVLSISTFGLQLAPAVTSVSAQPFVIKGNVADENLAFVSFNGQVAPVTALEASNTYAFELALQLTEGEELPLDVTAVDLAGNSVTQSYRLLLENPLSIEFVTPRKGAEFSSDSSAPMIDVVARVSGLSDDDILELSIDGNQQNVVDTQGLVNTQIQGPIANGKYPLTLTVKDSSGDELNSASVDIEIVNVSGLPVELLSYSPAAGDSGVEPNQFLSFEFNKPINPSLLSISVAETVNGTAYVPVDEQGKDFFEQTGPSLQEVSRVREPVAGAVAVLPGSTSLTYELGRDLLYNAEVFVEVIYDGEELARYSYQVRDLPTFVQGTVVDNFRVPLEGINISLPELGLVTQTNSDGAFSFGYGTPASENIQAGVYKFFVNDNFADARFGIINYQTSIQQGKVNGLPAFSLANLNREVPFSRIRSGQSQAVLAAGDVVLNFSDASLLFRNGRDQGDVHMQFMPAQQLNIPQYPGVGVSWVYATQPQGVEVAGDVGLTLQMPSLRGNYDYLPEENTPVLIMGYHSDLNSLIPVGIGRIQGHKVVSVGALPLKELDYLSVAFVDTVAELEKVIAGEQPLQAVLNQLRE